MLQNTCGISHAGFLQGYTPLFFSVVNTTLLLRFFVTLPFDDRLSAALYFHCQSQSSQAWKIRSAQEATEPPGF